MRIGIITYWTSQDNYGQLLQCFALQRFLRDHGHDAYVIRYIPQGNKKWGSRFALSHIIKYINYRLRQRRYNRTEKCKRDFARFRSHISWSNREYKGFDSLKNEDWSTTDAFICGSDQIWSEKPEEQLNAYFLRFAPFQKTRLAYAPSFGASQLSDDYQQRLQQLLTGFDALSIREKSGIEIVKKASFNAQLVVDPTLLLGRESYVNEFSLNTAKSKRAFCYFINWETDCDENKIIEFCRNSGLIPTLFATRGYNSKLPLNSEQSPEAWLQTISSAEFSIVNSFHGLVFSLIFHVPFAVYLLKGQHAAMNSRITSLLGLLGLEHRVVRADNTLEDVFNDRIDWHIIEERLAGMRAVSEAFLLTNLDKTDTFPQKTHNICFMTGGAVHHKYGGLDRVTEILADRFEADGHKVYYVSSRRREEYDHLRQYFLPDGENAVSAENGRFMTEFINKNHIDIVINQEANVNNCIPFQRPDGTKVISVLHFNPNYIDDRHFFKKFSKSGAFLKILSKVFFSITPFNNACLSYLRRKLGRNYTVNLQWSDRLVLLSHRFNPVMLSLLDNKSDIHKIESIHNPLAPDAFPSAAVDKEKIILFVGRLDNNFKRIDEIIDDVASVLAYNDEWSFVVCGDGPDRERLESYACQKSSRVKFVGFCDPRVWYDKASVIVLRSSKSEGWGMVLTEAMARGVVPVVAGSYESLPDIVTSGKDGVITCDSSDDFREGLRKTLSDETGLRQMSRNAQASARRFAVDCIVTQWYKLFEQ